MTFSEQLVSQKKIFYIAIVIIFALLIFYPLLSAGVIDFDDTSDLFKMLDPFNDYSLQHLFKRKSFFEYFRPLLMLSFVIDTKIWAFEYSGYHLTNIVFHTINAVLVYLIFYKLFHQESHIKVVALFVSLLFTIHPLVCESVAWISGRSDILGAFFFLAAFYLYISQYRFKSFGFVCCILAGLLSKENALAIFPIIIFTELFHTSSRKCAWDQFCSVIKLGMMLFIPLGVYFYLKFYGLCFPPMSLPLDLHKLSTLNGSHPVGGMEASKILPILAACGFYLKKLFIPWPLNFAIFSFNQVYYSAVFIVIAIGMVLLVTQKKYTIPIWFLFLVSAFIPAIPVIFTDVAWTSYAERYLYIGVSVWSIFLGYIYLKVSQRFLEHQRLIILMFGTLILCFGLTTVLRVLVWQDKEALWADTLMKNPNNGKVLYKYGEIIGGEKAFKYYQRAVDIGLDQDWKDFSLLILAKDAVNKGQNEKAFHYIEEALLIDQKPSRYKENCLIAVNLLSKMNGPTRQETMLYRQYEIECWLNLNRLNKSPMPLFKVASLYSHIGNHDKAVEYYKQLIQLFPQSIYSKHAQESLIRLSEKRLDSKTNQRGQNND